MNSRTYTAFAFLLRHPWLILSGLTTLLIFLLFQLPRLTLDASADSLVLEGDKALELYREMGKRYQSKSYLVVTYTPNESLFSPDVLKRLAQLRDELKTIPDVDSVITILDVPLLYSPPVSLGNLSRDIRYLHEDETSTDLARQEFRHSPLYKQLLTSPDERTTVLQINLERDDRFFQLLEARDQLRSKRLQHRLIPMETQQLAEAEHAFRSYSIQANERQRELVTQIRKVLDRHRDHATIFLGGVPMIAVDMISFIESDLITFGSAIILFIIALMALIFRRLRWMILPLLTCVVTCLIMLGFIAFADWQLTVISSNFTALLLIITLAITIHLVVRYREYYRAQPGFSQRQLVLSTLAFMAKPCLFTAITTMMAFVSLVVSDIRPVIDFGWMMSIGVGVALIMAFTLLPACLLMIPKGKSEIRGKTKPLTHYFARITDRYGITILVVSGFLLIASIIGIMRLKVENRFIDYFHETTEIYQGMLVIDQDLGGTIPLDILLRAPEAASLATKSTDNDPFDDDPFGNPVDNPFAESGTQSTNYWFTRSGLEQINKVQTYLESLDETGKVLSLNSLYQVFKDITGEELDDFQLALLRKNLPADVQPLLIDPYLSADGKETRITVRVMETSKGLQRDELLRQVQTFLINEMGYQPDQVSQTGMLVLYNNMLQSLFGSQISTLGAVFVAITLMFSLLFRSVFLALIAVAPNLLAAGVVLGVMGWANIPLDMMTITIAAITVGIGVDDTIHYIHRFRNEFPKDRNYRATMYRCHNSIGKAMFYTSVIIIAGFAILALSNFTPTIYFGLLTGLAMFSALMGALLLLPQLIISFKPLGPEQ
ncbi:MMPL family transporter [Pontibacterium granulatum]|uniref:efflux RND transporter permease subunit n=1 Tax=Pontibacterium granulatum TaxID=2036029 RepID=UPI002499C042|nr:MMPL family transporter [Pontibacterium granulatum]MDI3326580.1 MMPL family transporter [Pontibacterium granulatum]